MPTGFGGQSQQRWGDNTLNQNEFMRDIQMMDTSGKVCSTTDARKKGMVVLAFFRVNDAICDQVLPCLQKIADGYKESGKLTVWGVSQNGAADTVAYAKRLGITFPLLVDYDQYHAMVYGLTTFPTIYLADGSGITQRKITGFNRMGLTDISTRVAAFAGTDPVDLFGTTTPTIVAPGGGAAAAAVTAGAAAV